MKTASASGFRNEKVRSPAVERIAQLVLASLMRFALRRVRLLACVSEYPVGNALDLWNSFTFAQRFGLPLGVSIHVPYPHCRAMIKQLIKRGAGVVEVHVRLRGVTPDDAPDNGL